MRLLNAKTKKLELFFDHNQLPRYAIVSHRWGPKSEEVLFADVDSVPRAKRKGKGYAKVLAACQQAVRDGLSYVWLDTCCIDKSNQVELTEAINSMHLWYHMSAVCYAYLHDVDDISKLSASKWFQRGWTLQELIAPRTLMFFDKHWTFLGYRDTEPILSLVTDCTGIDAGVLGSERAPRDVSIAQRMRWAAGRITTKEEDRAYSLLGLFDVHMSAIYGIKHKAFEKLQHKIMKVAPDQSLFAWSPATGNQNAPGSVMGFLAASPSHYLNVYEIPVEHFYRRLGFCRAIWESSSFKSGVICTKLPIRKVKGSSTIYEVLLRCSPDPPQGSRQGQRPLVVYLTSTGRFGRYVRVHDPVSWSPYEYDLKDTFELEKIHVDQVIFSDPPPQTRTSISLHRVVTPSDPAPTSLGAGPDEPIAESPKADVGLQNRNAGRNRLRRPRRSSTTNIIVCGEPGAGAGGVVNLLLGRCAVRSRDEPTRDVMSLTTHDLTLRSRHLRIFYVVGPQDHQLDVAGYHTALQNAAQLARTLCDASGVHLLLYCTLRTNVDHKTYRLFYDALCGTQVPAVVLATRSGTTPKGDGRTDWTTGLRCQAHAMISVVRHQATYRATVSDLVFAHAAWRTPCRPRVRQTQLEAALRAFLTASAQRALASDPACGWLCAPFRLGFCA